MEGNCIKVQLVLQRVVVFLCLGALTSSWLKLTHQMQDSQLWFNNRQTLFAGGAKTQNEDTAATFPAPAGRLVAWCGHAHGKLSGSERVGLDSQPARRHANRGD